MSESTKIEWCDASWNPIRGCSMAKGSETGGCLNCYAARMCARGLPGLNSPTTGEPFAVMRDSGPRWTGKVELIESALELPLHWRKPRRIFVNSMSDLFHESLPNEAIDRVFAVMALCPQHTFQVLTKRPERMVAYLTGGPWGHIEQRASETIGTRREIPVEHLPLAHVHFGISCENQETADARIPLLLQTPAAVRFLSLEPLLSPVDLSKWHNTVSGIGDSSSEILVGIHQVIVGGESGPGARPMHPDWVRSIIQQCKAARVAVFVKQICARGRKIPFELWPADLQVRESIETHNEPSGVRSLAEPRGVSYRRSKEGTR